MEKFSKLLKTAAVGLGLALTQAPEVGAQTGKWETQVNKEVDKLNIERVKAEILQIQDEIYSQYRINVGFHLKLSRVRYGKEPNVENEEFVDLVPPRDVFEQLDALKQVKEELRYYKDGSLRDFVKTIIIGRANKIVDINGISTDARVAAAIADPEKSKIYVTIITKIPENIIKDEVLSSLNNKSYANLSLIPTYTIHHEIGHNLLDNITETEWLNAIYGVINYNGNDFNAGNRIRKPGFARAYGSYYYREDIATVTEVIFGGIEVRPNSELWNDAILRKKVLWIMEKYKEKFGADFFDRPEVAIRFNWIKGWAAATLP